MTFVFLEFQPRGINQEIHNTLTARQLWEAKLRFRSVGWVVALIYCNHVSLPTRRAKVLLSSGLQGRLR